MSGAPDKNSKKKPIEGAKKENGTEPFEFVDIPASRVNSLWVELEKSPAAVRIGAAMVPGLVSGYLAMKISKAAAFGFGGGLIVVYVGSRLDLVTINWDKLSVFFDEKKEIAERSESTWRKAVQSIRASTRRNPAILVGFASGFLIGLAYA